MAWGIYSLVVLHGAQTPAPRYTACIPYVTRGAHTQHDTGLLHAGTFHNSTAPNTAARPATLYESLSGWDRGSGTSSRRPYL